MSQKSLSINKNLFYCEEYNVRNPIAHLIIVHGLNEHCLRYKNFIQFLNNHQIGVFTYDQRGFGRSKGDRSFVLNFSDYLHDLDEIVKEVIKIKKPKVKNFLLGHSMGGQIVLNYMAEENNQHSLVDGVITSSANIKVAIKVPQWKRKLVEVLNKIYNKIPLPNELDPYLICSDKEVVKNYIHDPYCYKSIKSNLALEILKNQQAMMDLATKINQPCLIMHGIQDQICDAKGSEEFFYKIKSPQKDLKLYPKMYHEILNEIDKEVVYQDILNWIKDKI